MKKIKKPVSVFLALIMVVSLFTIVPFTAAAADTINGLTYNEEGDYYEIDSADALSALAAYVNAGNYCSGKTFMQTADITLSGTFTPIGSCGNKASFSGTFDGDNHTITGLNVSVTSSGWAYALAGLFGRLDSGEVKNVILIDPTVSCTSNKRTNMSGAIAGYAITGSSITHCFVLNPNISASNGTSNNYAGVISGQSSTSKNIDYCYWNGGTPRSALGTGTPGSHAEAVYKVTADANVGLPGTIDDDMGAVILGEHYYRSGTSVMLSYTGSNPDDYRPVYSAAPNSTGAIISNQGELTVGSGDITVSVELSSTPLVDLDTGVIDDIPEMAYTGIDLTPRITLTIGEKVLTEGTDYYLTYTNNRNVGTGTVTANGMGDYIGTLSKDFNIYYPDSTGSCGESAVYTLHDEDQDCKYERLTISGTGDTADYESESDMPWYSSRNDVTEVIVENGITRIGDLEFASLKNMTSISLPEGLKSIGEGAFRYCSKLDFLTIPASVESIGYDAFDSIAQSIDATLIFADGSKLNSVSSDAFKNIYSAVDMSACTKLTEIQAYTFEKAHRNVVLPYSLTSIAANAFLGASCPRISIDLPAGYKMTVNGAEMPVVDGKINITRVVDPTSSGSDAVTLTCTPDPVHFSVNEAGTEYTIKTATGWDVFCDLLAENNKGYFTGKTVLLGDDISVTRMAGGSYHDFTGTFDGQGHTLTVSCGSETSPINEDKAAPFRNVEGDCVIKNLRTAGTIFTSKKYASGFIGTQYGSVTVKNCRSSVTIKSSTNGDGTHGGYIGNAGGSVITIEGCVFDGKILSVGDADTTRCSGFVGYRINTVDIINSVYAPAALEAGENEASIDSATFVRNGSAGENCYYTRALGTTENQGKQAYSISAAERVAIALSGEATVYSVSGITVYDGNSGIKYDGTYYAEENAAVTLRLSHASLTGWTFNGYTADKGTLVGADNPFILNMPAESVTISGLYEQIDYAITTTVSHGTLTVTVGETENPVTAHYGDKVNLTVTPDEDYGINYVTVNGKEITASDGEYSFHMPDKDVTVIADIRKLSDGVNYIDSDGEEKITWAVPLDNTMTTLEEGWYVVNGDVTFTTNIIINGTVNLILADGCTMSVGTEEAPITSAEAIKLNGVNIFTVYGQSGGSGTLKAYSSSKNAFYSNTGSYIQNGGNVVLQTTGNYAHALNSYFFTINGGTLNAATTGKSSNAVSVAFSININGGNFTASCEYSGDSDPSYGASSYNGNIVLGYRSAEDSIQTCSFYVRKGQGLMVKGSVRINYGITFTDGTNLYNNNTSTEVLEALTNVTLTPANTFGVIIGECTNGAVTAPAKAFSGGTVTLNLLSAEGYVPTVVTVNGVAIEPVNGVYSFEMPSENVTVSADFGLMGDANRDGIVDVRDVTAIQRHLADLEIIPEQFLILADSNGDGYIDIDDATCLQMYLAEYDIELGKQTQVNT